MAFEQGLSGLSAASKNLDVIGNNVANVNTVGFKESDAHFADVYATAGGLVGSNTPGIGTRVSAIQQSFSQGSLTATSNPLDLAINGSGFFRCQRQRRGRVQPQRPVPPRQERLHRQRQRQPADRLSGRPRAASCRPRRRRTCRSRRPT